MAMFCRLRIRRTLRKLRRPVTTRALPRRRPHLTNSLSIRLNSPMGRPPAMRDTPHPRFPKGTTLCHLRLRPRTIRPSHRRAHTHRLAHRRNTGNSIHHPSRPSMLRNNLMASLGQLRWSRPPSRRALVPLVLRTRNEPQRVNT